MSGTSSVQLRALGGKGVGRSCWIVGSGPSLDMFDLSLLEGQVIFALNAAIELFTDIKKYPEAWWIYWDMRAFKQVWPRIEKQWSRFQVFVNKRAMEMMRPIKHNGRYVYYVGDAFKPVRTVVETALWIAGFLGFTRIYLAGIDFSMGDRPYAKALNWKTCYFYNPKKPGSAQKSFVDMYDAMNDAVKKKLLDRSVIYQTSRAFPKMEGVEFCSFGDAVERTMAEVPRVVNGKRKRCF